MAILTNEEQDILKIKFNEWRVMNTLTFLEARACLNDVNQAIEDEMQNAKQPILNAIDTASAPYGISYSNAQKKQLVLHWFGLKFNLDDF